MMSLIKPTAKSTIKQSLDRICIFNQRSIKMNGMSNIAKQKSKQRQTEKIWSKSIASEEIDRIKI